MKILEKIRAAWVNWHGEPVYTWSHSQACVHTTDSEGNVTTVNDVLNSIDEKTLVQRAKVSQGHSTNINDYKDQCRIYIDSTMGMTGLPGNATNGWLEVYSSTANTVKHVFYRSGTIGTTDYRTYVRTWRKSEESAIRDGWSTWAEQITDKTKVITPHTIKFSAATLAASTSTYPAISDTKSTVYINGKAGDKYVTIMAPGTYAMFAKVSFDPQSSTTPGYRKIQIERKKLAETEWASVLSYKLPIGGKEYNTTSFPNTATVYRRFSTGDRVRLMVRQYSGSGKSLKTTSGCLEITYVGA